MPTVRISRKKRKRESQAAAQKAGNSADATSTKKKRISSPSSDDEQASIGDETPPTASSPNKNLNTSDSDLDDLLNDDIGGFGKQHSSTGASSCQTKLITSGASDSIGLSASTKYAGIMDSGLLSLLQQDDVMEKKHQMDSFDKLLKERQNLRKVEQERKVLEEQRLNIEKLEQERARNQPQKERQDQALQDSMDNKLESRDTTNDFPHEVILPPFFQTSPVSRQPGDKPFTSADIVYSGSVLPKGQEESLLQMHALYNNMGLTSDEILWLMKLALPPPQQQQQSESSDNAGEDDSCFTIWSDLSGCAYNTLTSPLLIHSAKQCPSFENIQKMVQESMGVDIMNAPGFLTPSNTNDSTSEETEKIGSMLNSPSQEQLASLERFVNWMPNVILHADYSSEELTQLFYFFCSAACISYGRLLFGLLRLFEAFGKLHSTADNAWAFPSDSEFVSKIPFVAGEEEDTLVLNSFVRVLLRTLMKSKQAAVKCFASQCARAYFDQYVDALPPVECETLFELDASSNDSLTQWMNRATKCLSERHTTMLRDIESSDREVMQKSVLFCTDLYWMLNFFSVALFDTDLYTSKSEKNHLSAQSVEKHRKKIGSLLDLLKDTGNLYAGHSNVVRFSLYSNFVDDLFKYSFDQFLQRSVTARKEIVPLFDDDDDDEEEENDKIEGEK